MTTNLNSGGFVHVLLVVALALFKNGSAFADAHTSNTNDSLCVNGTNGCEIRSRLSAFEPNYVIWQNTEGDENALEVHYSFRYMFTRPHCARGHDIIYEYSDQESRECINNYKNRWELYFAYTGEFDFYVGTRPSGPVVNRISNPGIHYRKHIPNRFYEWFDLSLQHRSNGQVTEIDETDGGVLKTQTAFDSGDHAYFDGISRGANFIKLEVKFEPGKTIGLYVSGKSYINHDSEVNWGPDALDNPTIKDYDRLKFIYTDRWRVKGINLESSVEWLIGDKGLDTDSFDIDFMFPIKWGKLALPWYVRIHSGPMNTLSNYTLDQDTIGIGFKLVPF